MATMRIDWHDGTALVRFTRPPVNAFNLELVAQLRATFEELAADPPRGVVVTGDGAAFCGGVDVKEVPAYDEARRAEMVAEINAMITALYGLPTATVAAVGGHAIGAGMVVMLACDARIVAEGDARLGLTEVTAGISYPAGPMEVISAEVEPSHRRHLVLTGETLGPREALAARLVDAVVLSRDLVPRALELARGRAAAPAYREVKQQLRAATLERMRAIVADERERSGLSR